MLSTKVTKNFILKNLNKRIGKMLNTIRTIFVLTKLSLFINKW